MTMWKKICAGVLGTLMMFGAGTGLTQTASAEEAAAQTPKAVTGDIADRKIIINLAARSLALYQGNERVRLYPIGPGKASTPTPVGYYKIITKDLNPTWTDPEDSANSIPSGPSNPLGYRWMGFTGNYGIHGTNHPESIGHYVSNGCVRMNEKNAEDLYDLIQVGTPLEIGYNRVVVEKAPDSNVVYYIYPDGYGWQKVSAADVMKWLKGYGVSDFVDDADVQAKVDAATGEPNYVGKVYALVVNGTKMKGKAFIKDDITYLPAAELAAATKTSLSWNTAGNTLITPNGQAVGYQKKDNLYCNADDVSTLFKIDGGLTNGVYTLGTPMAAPVQEKAAEPENKIVPIVENGKILTKEESAAGTKTVPTVKAETKTAAPAAATAAPAKTDSTAKTVIAKPAA